jgi:hypothetical protein
MAEQMTSSIKKWLIQANKKWQEEASRAKEENGLTQFDDGRYYAQLKSCELTETKSGNPVILWTFKILEGEYAGQVIRRYRTLENDNIAIEDGLKWAARDLLVYGYDPEDVHFDYTRSKEDGFIVNVLNDLAGQGDENPVVILRLKTKGDYQNIDVDKVLSDYTVDSTDKDDSSGDSKMNKANTSKNSIRAKETSTKKTQTVDVQEYEEEEVDELPEEDDINPEEVELAVGMKVAFLWKGETLEGTVREILENENKVKVKVGNKIYPVSGDVIELVEAETD